LPTSNLNLELHAQWIRVGKGTWGAIPRAVKAGLLRDIPAALAAFTRTPGAALFAVARAPKGPHIATFRKVVSKP